CQLMLVRPSWVPTQIPSPGPDFITLILSFTRLIAAEWLLIRVSVSLVLLNRLMPLLCVPTHKLLYRSRAMAVTILRLRVAGFPVSLLKVAYSGLLPENRIRVRPILEPSQRLSSASLKMQRTTLSSIPWGP